jgi:hypothetical protein
MELMTNLNTVGIKGGLEFARGVAAQLVQSESEVIRDQV